jgi:hypothetical protein
MMISQKEAIRAQVMGLLTAGKIDQKEAGKRISFTCEDACRPSALLNKIAALI